MNKTPKSHRGSAYLMVLSITMLVIMMVSITMSVTMISRRVSVLYSDNVGLYDLAVSGNEQALLLLHQHIATQQQTISEYAWARIFNEALLGGFIGFIEQDGALRFDDFTNNKFKEIYIEAAMAHLNTSLGGIFARDGANYRLNWGINASINTNERILIDSYQAITTLRPTGNNFTVTTVIHKQVYETTSYPASVRASLIWTADGYREMVLDAYTIELLEAAMAIFPNVSIYGANMVLILDEFTFAMVESLRVIN